VLPDPRPSDIAFPPTLPLLDATVALTLVAAHTVTVKVASGNHRAAAAQPGAPG
jgi:hypothetical protein